ncbi:S41 family peptidase [Clostridium sp.]|uniref:S41 family peptidase n=1 Tax=Clostridium sp. TaxID=1506 RepID=UPI003D6CB7F9
MLKVINNYFGGDEKFLKAKENILKEIKQLKEENFGIVINTLEQVICKKLEFIQDGHFSIGSCRPCKDYIMYTTEEYEVEKVDNSYFLKLQNNVKYIVTINNEHPEKYIKPSINENGNIIYRLCALEERNEDILPMNIKFKDGNNEENISINLENTSRNYVHKGSSNSYTYEEIYNIPVIDLNSFVTSKELEEFAEDGKKVSKKDLVIIDLRGNSGGSEAYAFDWIKNFTKQEYKSPGFSSTLLTKNSKEALLYTGKKMTESSEDYVKLEQQINDMYKKVKSEPEYMGWSQVKHEESIHINNEKLIFVLMNKSTASAAESFVKTLRSCSNTFFIGTNTSGMSNVGNLGLYVLPNSKIDVFFGNTPFVDNDLKWRDGLGVLPDFWVDSKNAEYRLLRFIKNYSQDK